MRYLSHDNESEQPVYFQWQLLDWHLAQESLDVDVDGKGQDLNTIGSLVFSKNKPTKKSKRGDTVEEFNSKKSPDYAARDQANKVLGDLGEELVLKHEIHKEVVEIYLNLKHLILKFVTPSHAKNLRKILCQVALTMCQENLKYSKNYSKKLLKFYPQKLWIKLGIT